MSIGGPKSFDGVISVGRVIGNGTKDSPTGIVDSTQSGLQQISFPEWGNNVNPQDIALSTNIGTKPHSNKRPFDNGQLVYALRTSGRTDCIILGPASDVLDPQSMPGNHNLNILVSKLNSAIEYVYKLMRQKPKKRVDARGYGTKRPDPNTDYYRHNIKKGIVTAAEMAQMAGFKMPSIGNIPTAVQQFAGIMNPSSFGSIPGMNMSLGNSLKKLKNEDKKKIQDAIPPELWEILLSLIDSLEEMSDDDMISYVSERRVNEEEFIKNAVELLSQVTTVSDIMAVFDRLISDETLYGLDKLNDIVIEIETAFGNVKQIISANGNTIMNVSNTVANTMSSFESALNSTSSFPLGMGGNIFGKDASNMMNMIQRMAPQAQKRALATLNDAVGSGRAKENAATREKTHGENSGKPADSIAWTQQIFDTKSYV